MDEPFQSNSEPAIILVCRKNCRVCSLLVDDAGIDQFCHDHPKSPKEVIRDSWIRDEFFEQVALFVKGEANEFLSGQVDER